MKFNLVKEKKHFEFMAKEDIEPITQSFDLFKDAVDDLEDQYQDDNLDYDHDISIYASNKWGTQYLFFVMRYVDVTIRVASEDHMNLLPTIIGSIEELANTYLPENYKFVQITIRNKNEADDLVLKEYFYKRGK